MFFRALQEPFELPLRWVPRTRRVHDLDHLRTLSQEVHLDLPRAQLLRVEVRWQVIVRVEPQLEAVHGDAQYSRHRAILLHRTL